MDKKALIFLWISLFMKPKILRIKKDWEIVVYFVDYFPIWI